MATQGKRDHARGEIFSWQSEESRAEALKEPRYKELALRTNELNDSAITNKADMDKICEDLADKAD